MDDGTLSNEHCAIGQRLNVVYSVCPGRYIADASVWIILSSIIAAFDFYRADETGGLDHPFAAGALRQVKLLSCKRREAPTYSICRVPLPFNVRFEPRSSAIERHIREDRE